MTILTMIVNQKTHIVYGIIILTLTGIAYNFFSRKPKEIVKTEYITKEVVRNVETKRNRLDEKTTTIKSVDGTITTINERISDNTVSKSKTTADTRIEKKTIEKFLSKYTISTMYPLEITNIMNPTFNPMNLQVIGGVRIFSLPVFVNVGTNVRLNTVLVGVTFEF